MESLIIFSGFAVTFFLVMAVFGQGASLSPAQSRVLHSLGRTQQSQGAKNGEPNHEPNNKKNDFSAESKDGFAARVHRLLNSLAKKQKRVAKIDQDLIAAGMKQWTSAEWNVLKSILALSMALAGLAASYFAGLSLLATVEIALVGFLTGLVLPNSWLKSKIRQREEEIVRTLPDTLDLIMVSVEAGLGFDAAMMKVVEKQKGALAAEFNTVLQEIKIGKPRREALKDMAKRNQIEDLSNVIAALVQADQLGISIGSVLRNQAKQVRQKRRLKAQEQAQKAPVKIMIPLVFFIFPSVFIVILGPAVITIMDFLAK